MNNKIKSNSSQEILNQYIRVLNFLSETLGPDHEITLFDLSSPNGKLIAIANNDISGRGIGIEITPLIKKKIAEKHYLHADGHFNYNTVAPNGNVIRSSTLYIKNSSNELIGVMCINFNDNRYKDLSKKIFELCHPNNFVSQTLKIDIKSTNDDKNSKSSDDIELENVDNAAGEVLDLLMNSIAIPVDRLTKDEKLEIIKKLDSQGFFMLKGAIPYLRDRLHMSQPTIYRYLKLIKK